MVYVVLYKVCYWGIGYIYFLLESVKFYSVLDKTLKIPESTYKLQKVKKIKKLFLNTI